MSLLETVDEGAQANTQVHCGTL